MLDFLIFAAGVACGYAAGLFHVKRKADKAATAKGTIKPPGGGGGPGEP